MSNNNWGGGVDEVVGRVGESNHSENLIVTSTSCKQEYECQIRDRYSRCQCKFG
jgi:hypothetical protein